MNFQSATIIVVVLLVASASAEWMVAGHCGGNKVNGITISNGNCSPNGSFYNLIVTKRGKAHLHWCTDSACTSCTDMKDYEIIPFDNCTTTAQFRYTTKTNPESAVIALLGGMAYGFGDSYDNCTTACETGYYAANRCNSYPKKGISQRIDCTPGEQTGLQINYGHDAMCQGETSSSPLPVGTGCNGDNSGGKIRFSFCKFQK